MKRGEQSNFTTKINLPKSIVKKYNERGESILNLSWQYKMQRKEMPNYTKKAISCCVCDCVEFAVTLSLRDSTI